MTNQNWELLTSIVGTIVWLMQIPLYGVFFYYLIISAFAWVKRRETPAANFPIKHSFAILVAAHNEETVIHNIVENLKRLNYPKHMYDIFVIADNCNDNTAAIARNHGALVYERTDTVKRGKGYSLEWMFNKLFKMEKQYDAVCVLDADNLISANFLLEMNKHMCMGHKVVQGYLDSKNPSDSWISGNNSIAFWISNRLIQLPRYYLGLSCVLGGTGFIVATDVLKEFGWGATCLTEDLEFTMKLISKGMKVYWSHEAVIYDEKPLKLMQSWRQRKRWMQGHFDCARRFFGSLLSKAVREKSITAFDGAMYLIQPLIVVINGFGILWGAARVLVSLGYVMLGLKFPLVPEKYYIDFSGSMDLYSILSIILMLAFMYLSVTFVIIEGKISKRIFKYIMLLPIYNLTWVPIIIRGFMDRNKKEWSHTVHTRAMDITEVEDILEKAG